MTELEKNEIKLRARIASLKARDPVGNAGIIKKLERKLRKALICVFQTEYDSTFMN